MIDDTLSENENLEEVADEGVELLVELDVPERLYELLDRARRLQRHQLALNVHVGLLKCARLLIVRVLYQANIQ